MVSFENFVKSLPPSLSELKVKPIFCFPIKIRDDPTASNKYSNSYEMWKPLSIKITSRLRFVNLFVEGSRVCDVRYLHVFYFCLLYSGVAYLLDAFSSFIKAFFHRTEELPWECNIFQLNILCRFKIRETIWWPRYSSFLKLSTIKFEAT